MMKAIEVPTNYNGSEEREASLEQAALTGTNPKVTDVFYTSGTFRCPAKVGDAAFGAELAELCKAGHYPGIRGLKLLTVEARTAFYQAVAVGEGLTKAIGSDRHACTVIKKSKSGKTFTVQRDVATLNKDFKLEMSPGGFVGHATNQDDQSYTYAPDPQGSIYKARIDREGWLRFQHQSTPVILGRSEFYDYNF